MNEDFRSLELNSNDINKRIDDISNILKDLDVIKNNLGNCWDASSFDNLNKDINNVNREGIELKRLIDNLNKIINLINNHNFILNCRESLERENDHLESHLNNCTLEECDHSSYYNEIRRNNMKIDNYNKQLDDLVYKMQNIS